MWDPLYVLVLDSETFGIDNSVMCLEPGEVVAPNNGNNNACLEEMDSDTRWRIV